VVRSSQVVAAVRQDLNYRPLGIRSIDSASCLTTQRDSGYSISITSHTPLTGTVGYGHELRGTVEHSSRACQIVDRLNGVYEDQQTSLNATGAFQ
jgi:hypothetical protein